MGEHRAVRTGSWRCATCFVRSRTCSSHSSTVARATLSASSASTSAASHATVLSISAIRRPAETTSPALGCLSPLVSPGLEL